MNTVIHNKVGSSILILGGFAIWIGGSILIPHAMDWYFAFSNSLGGLAFFLVGCFLPEYRTASFFSRKSAIGLMGVFAWMAAGAFIQHPSPFYRIVVPDHSFIDFSAPILIGLISCWIAIFLIRGIRATPEYLTLEQRPNNPPNDSPAGC